MPSTAIGLELENIRHRVGGGENIGEADYGKHTLRRTVDQIELGLQNIDAGGLGADQRAGDVEAFFRQQLVEVFVAGHAARNIGQTRADQIGVFVAEIVERPVDLGAPAAGLQDVAQLVVARSGRRSCARRHR